MKAYHIKLNGKYYVGEADETYKCDTSGQGWYQINKGEMPKLIFDVDIKNAKLVESWLNLRSDLDRILKRERENELSIELLEVIEVK